MEKNKEIITAKKALSEHNKLKSCWSNESRLSQKIMVAILSHLEKTPKKKRAPSAYNLFVAQEMQKGLTMKEASLLWKKEK